MAFVLQCDPNFHLLYDQLSSNAEPLEITTSLGIFRKNLCLSWLIKFLAHSPTNSLQLVITTLLNCTEHSNANVRITAYSTLGALVLTIAPFNPRLFIRAFGNSVASRPVAPRSSIAVINMFVYLSRFVSPVHLQEFIILVPVINHFKADVSDFLKFIPLVAPLMTALPVSFHESILRTIICGCGENPTSALTNSVQILVSLNKKSLTPYVISLLKECKFAPVISALGPILLSDDETYEYLRDEGRDIFLKSAVFEMEKERPRFMEFECSCQTCSILLKRYKGTEKFAAIGEIVHKTLSREIASHFKRLFLILEDTIDGIFKEKSTSDSFKSAQLASLSSLVVEKPDNIDCDKAADIFMSFVDSKNDLYCSLIESFAKCVNVLLQKCKKDTPIKLLKILIQKKNRNWVQDIAVSNLIAGLDHKIANKLIPGLFEKEMERLLEFVNSPNKKLSETAISSICSIASYRNLSYILSLIVVSQWIDEDIVAKRFDLLSQLVELFEFDEFHMFVPIAYECILFCESMAALSAIFKFLKFIKVTYLPVEIRDFCYKFIISSYESFTQTSLLIPNSSLNIPIPPTAFLESYDTDIVSNPTFDHKIVLQPIQSCFEFLCRVDKEVLGDTNVLFWLCINLIPLFDEVALDKAIELNVEKIVSTPKLWTLILETFMSTSREAASASCCKLFVETKCDIPPQIHMMIEKCLIEQRACHPDLLFFCFVLIDMEDHEKALSTLPTMQKLIGPKKGVPLMFRLANVLGKSVVSFVDDDFVFALLTFANFGVSEAEKRILDYMKCHKYSEWNIYDDSLNAELLTFLQNKEKVTVSNFNELDKEHWIFALAHRDVFDLIDLDNYVLSSPGTFSKIKEAPLPPIPQEKFVFTEVEEDKRQSVSFEMRKETLVESTPLLISFFSNSEYAITDQFASTVFDYVKSDEKTLSEFMKYCARVGVNLKLDTLLDEPKCLQESILPLTIHFAKMPVNELPDKLKAAIASLTMSLEACDIVRGDKFQIFEALAKNDPDYFLKFFQEFPRFSSKNFKALIKALPTVDFSGVTLNDIASQQLTMMISFESTKQKCVLLRFLTVCLSSLRSRKAYMEMRSIAALVTAMLSDIFDGASSSMYCEFTNLLFILSQVTVMYDVLISFINSFVRNYGSSFLYMNQSSILVCLKRQEVESLTYESLISSLEYNIPSITSCCLRALTNFVQRGADQHVIRMVDVIVNELTPSISTFARNVKTASCLLPLVSRLLMNTKKFGENTQLLMEFTSVFFADPNSPCFSSAIPLISQLVSLYPSMITRLFSLKFINSVVSDAMSDVFDKNKEEVYKMTLDFFISNQNILIANLLVEFSKETDNVKNSLNELKKVTKNAKQVSLPMFLAIHKLMKIENPSLNYLPLPETQ